jgi:hypothetical protein
MNPALQTQWNSADISLSRLPLQVKQVVAASQLAQVGPQTELL